MNQELTEEEMRRALFGSAEVCAPTLPLPLRNWFQKL